MLGWLLGYVAYDTIKTLNEREKSKQINAQIRDLEWRLQKPQTQGHYNRCVCLLCHNRKIAKETKLKELKQEKKCQQNRK